MAVRFSVPTNELQSAARATVQLGKIAERLLNLASEASDAQLQSRIVSEAKAILEVINTLNATLNSSISESARLA
ncbi:MAG: hypothetical protein JO264_07715 [Acidisphaera sp.]|nr:hypothetical protein [Acidisphaera sp.]